MYRPRGGNVCACLRAHVGTKRGRAASSSTHLPRGYWHDKANQRDFLDQVAKELGIKEFADWYKVSRFEIEKRGGTGMFNYHASLGAALQDIYPEHPWNPTQFLAASRMARGGWQSMTNKKQFFDKIAKDLGLTDWTDWYNIQRHEIVRRGGGSIFHHHGSLADALTSIYPNHPWDPKRFATGRVPAGYWNDQNNLFSMMEKAEITLGITKPEDWYSVNLTDLREIGFPNVSKSKLVELLAIKYSDFSWERIYMLNGKRAQQKRLEKAVSTLFPGQEVLFNIRAPAELVNPDTGHFMELDVWVPSLNLAFEYQEKHHYTGADYTYQPMDYYQKRDAMKKGLAQARGITLVIVPCWWDGKHGSLMATIKKSRPDLFSGIEVADAPISEQLPPSFLEDNTAHVADIGQPITASFFTLSDINPTGWWLFEKYDGVRGLWNPLKRKFFSRFGKELSLPRHIIDAMPSDIFLDGELWFGRENFQEAMKVVRKKADTDLDWKNFKYMVFDLPNLEATYAERYARLESRLGQQKREFLELAPKVECTDVPHLETLFQNIVDKGGEGIILRDPNANYHQGRSQGYLKHKKFRDGEAKIVGPAGLHQWECELPNGVRFTAVPATTEFSKRCNPVAGDIVSFKHRGYLLATKKPKLATLYRVRTDVTWEDVVDNWKEHSASKSGGLLRRPENLTPKAYPFRRAMKRYKPKGYWNKLENRKKYFTEFATVMGFDPNSAAGWRSVTKAQLIILKGSGPLTMYSSLREGLTDTFPHLEFDEVKPRGHWKLVANCKKLFDEYARRQGFDPLKPENWYSVDLELLGVKQGWRKIKEMNGTLQLAIQGAYPDVVFDHWHPSKHKSKFWMSPKNTRLFFDDYALSQNFNPRDPQAWRATNFDDMLQRMGGWSIKQYYGDFETALKNAYAEVDWAARS